MTTQTNNAAAAETEGSAPIISQFERAFGLSRVNGSFFRQGFNFGSPEVSDEDIEEARRMAQAEEGRMDEQEMARLLAISDDDPDRARRLAAAFEHEQRLQNDLRSAGLL